MTTLAIVIVVVLVVLVALFVGGLFGARGRSRETADQYSRNLAGADRALEQARAADRGWDRDAMEGVAREALEQAHPGVTFERLDLVLVDDHPGVEEDRALFEAVAGDLRASVALSRAQRGWSAERVSG